MIEVNSNHCQVVRESLTGEKVADEQAFVSLAILTERLERLKKHGDSFSDIMFSTAVERLRSQKNPVAVG